MYRHRDLDGEDCAPKALDGSSGGGVCHGPANLLRKLFAFNFSAYPTKNFRDCVINKDPEVSQDGAPDSSTIIRQKCYDSYDDENYDLEEDEIPTRLSYFELPTDPLERQKALVKHYTMETPLYHEMNTALRNDDRGMLTYYGAYIKELRGVFETLQKDRVVKWYLGTVWRGIYLDDVDAALADLYLPDKEFVWTAFTSTSTDKDTAQNFGNVCFEVSCKPPVTGSFDDDEPEFAPADIMPLSDMPHESEILFPPNTRFRVVNVQMPTDENGLYNPMVICETLGYDSVWGLIDSGEKIDVKKFLDAHPSLKRGNNSGLVHSYAHKALDAGHDDMAQELVDDGYASDEETCPNTGADLNDRLG